MHRVYVKIFRFFGESQRRAVRQGEHTRALFGDFFIHVFIEKANRNFENFADVPQTACADTVHAAFIFLHLLESQSQQRSQFFLAEAEQRAS